jgi:hypothetical protein
MGHYYLYTIAEPAPPADAYEPNDTPLTARRIELDLVADLTFTPRDVDWFEFSLAEPGFVAANAVGDGFAPIVALLDADLERIGFGWWRVGADLTTGTYYLGVAPSDDWHMEGSHWRTGDYRLEVQAIGPDVAEPNDLEARATELTLGTSTPQLSLVPRDVDWFRFELSSRHHVTLYLRPQDIGIGTDYLMWLLDDTGQVLWRADDGYARIDIALDAGAYSVAVSGTPDWDRVGDHAQAFLYELEFSGYAHE